VSPPDALQALLGEPRAALLRALDRAATERSGDEPAGRGSGELAERMLLVPSGITHHLDVLEPAGLVVRERRGRCVLVHRTVLGARLLALYDNLR